MFMRRIIINTLIVGMILSLFLSNSVVATNNEENRQVRDEIIERIMNAFDAQVALSEMPRTKEEMKKIIYPYFTDEFVERYLQENSHEVNGKYIVYGTDSPTDTIPFFSYNEATKVIVEESSIIVYEFFPSSNDGPVSYSDHYELVYLQNLEGEWKVNEINPFVENPEFIEEEKNNSKEMYETVPTIDTVEKASTHSMYSELPELDYFLQSEMYFLSFFTKVKEMINKFN